MREINKIYISGPITGTTDYMDRFALTERKFSSVGYAVINPAKVNACMPKNTSWEQYMRMSFTMLEQADTIYMMRGWEDSPGARAELAFAWKYQKNIIYEESADGEL
jgi:hypothetical protein